MKKNDVIETVNALITLHDDALAYHGNLKANAQSPDEANAQQKEIKKHETHIKYLSRLTQSEAIQDAFASACVKYKLTADQIKEVDKNAYSIVKFVDLMISLIQKRKISGEYSFVEFVTRMVLDDRTDGTSHDFCRTMRTKNGTKYGNTQANQALCMLERINAFKKSQNGKQVVYSANTDSAIYKTMISYFE